MLQSRAIREGSIGLFALLGLLIFSGITLWLRGGGFGQKGYEVTVEFTDVGGLQVGAPVRYRGVTIGKIQGFQASSNVVKARIEISSADIRIPREVTVQTNRSGLIGEASVDITPLVSLSPEAQKIDPLSKECQSQGKILCNDDLLVGEAGDELLDTMNRLAQAYGDPAFVNNLNNATKNTALAAAKIAKLSDDVALVLRATQKNIDTVSQNFSGTSRSLTQTANRTYRLIDNLDSTIGENRLRISKTVDDTDLLVRNLNSLLIENRSRLILTVDNINQASTKISDLATNLNNTAIKVNNTIDSSDTATLVKNLETVINNAAATSENLRLLSQQLNDPTILLTVQKTLESARVTFENTQKITSDLDELTGDPEFRNNLRKLVNGLEDLVSSTEQLEYHIQVSQALQSASQELTKPPLKTHPVSSDDSPTSEKKATPSTNESE